MFNFAIKSFFVSIIYDKIVNHSLAVTKKILSDGSPMPQLKRKSITNKHSNATLHEKDLQDSVSASVESVPVSVDNGEAFKQVVRKACRLAL